MTPASLLAVDLQGKKSPEVAAFILNTFSISSTHRANLPYQLHASWHAHSLSKGGQPSAGHGPTMAGGGSALPSAPLREHGGESLCSSC